MRIRQITSICDESLVICFVLLIVTYKLFTIYLLSTGKIFDNSLKFETK